MQYGRTLNRVLQDIVFADPALCPVCMLKVDVSDEFYQISLRPADAPKLELLFPGKDSKELVTVPLTLPMGWKNSPPLFCMATETVADLANIALCCIGPVRLHKLHDRVEAANNAAPPTLFQAYVDLTRNPVLQRTNARLLAYFDVFVDDFLCLAQGPQHQRRHVRRHLFHALDKIFRPLDEKTTQSGRTSYPSKSSTRGTACGQRAKCCLVGWSIQSI